MINEKSGKVKLYNMVLPIWLLWIVPVCSRGSSD